MAVLGLGRAGLANCIALEAAKVNYSAWDDHAQAREQALDKRLNLADSVESFLSDTDLMIISPGIPHTLPQPHPTVKLAKELSKRDTGKTLYILDEPTTGLHFYDIENLLAVLHRLRDKGNTVVVIEHNLDVIKTADWVIDLGPEGGDGGGEIIATGTPEDVATNDASFTGQYLRHILAVDNRQQVAAE